LIFIITIIYGGGYPGKLFNYILNEISTSKLYQALIIYLMLAMSREGFKCLWAAITFVIVTLAVEP